MTAAVPGVLCHLLMTPPVPVVVVTRPVARRVHTVARHADHADARTQRRRTEDGRALSGLVGHALASLRSAHFFRWALLGCSVPPTARFFGCEGLARLPCRPQYWKRRRSNTKSRHFKFYETEQQFRNTNLFR